MKDLVLNNLGWKLLSLAVAAVLWIGFAGSPELTTSVSAPIQYQNIPPNLEMITDFADRVHLEIQGSAARLNNYDMSRTAVILNLSAVNRPGERTFSIDSHDVALPPGLNLMRAVPGQVRIQFEQRSERLVPVKVRFSHQPADGYRVRKQVLEPAKLSIVGPESRVGNVEYAETDPIDLSRVIGPTEFHVTAFIPDPQVRFNTRPLVTVRVVVEKPGR